MRKSVLIILLLSIIVFISACGSPDDPVMSSEPIETAQDKEQHLTENAEPDRDNQEPLVDRLSTIYVDMMKNDKYTMKYRAFMEMEGVETETEITLVISEGRTAMKMETDSITNTTIIKEEKMHMVDHNSQTVMVMPFNTEDIVDDTVQPQDIEASNMGYIGKGTGEFMGNIRDYEEYSVEDAKVLYYFDGEDLVGMEMISDSGSFLIDIELMSDDVDESIFEIPVDYQIMEMGI